MMAAGVGMEPTPVFFTWTGWPIPGHYGSQGTVPLAPMRVLLL